MLHNFTKFVLGFFVGGVIGVGTASLFAPKNGSDVRADIQNGVDEIRLNFELGREKRREELEAEIKQRCGESL